MRVLVLLLLLEATANAQSVSCLAPGDSSVSQLSTLTDFMTPGDTSATYGRGVIGIAGLDTSDMRLVTNDSLCARVDSAVMKASVPPVLHSRVVYQLGTNRYATFTPGPVFTTLFFVDDHFEVILMVH